MSTISKEILEDIIGMVEKGAATKGPEPIEPEAPIVEIEVGELVGYDLHNAEGNVIGSTKTFVEVFGWEPESVPNHLVKTYTAFEASEPMEGYVIDKRIVEQFSFCESVGLKQNLVGPTGCGKTQLAEWYASKCGRPYMRISHTQGFDPETVFGRREVTDGETDFVLGALPLTFNKPYVLLLDEVTRAPSDALMTYGPLLDRREFATPEMKESSLGIMRPCEGWSVCGADNTKGNGDGLDKYISSNVVDSAFTNRWDVIHEMDYLSVDDEKAIIKYLAPNVDDTLVARLAKLSAELHKADKKGDITVSFSPRNLQAIASMMEAGMPMDQAFKMNFLSRVPESELSDVKTSYHAVTGESL